MTNNSKTIVITGSSSGIGYETAKYFAKNNWNVIATMRNPEKRKSELLKNENIEVLHLDVTEINSIKKVLKYTIEKYGSIDAVVNNAGYASFGVFEASSKESVKKLFNTNVIGLMDVCRLIIPIFRKQKKGLIINITSAAGKMTFPLYSIYNSSKWAVEGFSEALQFELKQFNIQVKIIEPGIINTDFYGRSKDIYEINEIESYKKITKKMMNYEKENIRNRNYSEPIVIAKTIYKAANDGSWKLRYYSGKYSRTILWLRRILPEKMFIGIIRTLTIK